MTNVSPSLPVLGTGTYEPANEIRICDIYDHSLRNFAALIEGADGNPIGDDPQVLTLEEYNKAIKRFYPESSAKEGAQLWRSFDLSSNPIFNHAVPLRGVIEIVLGAAAGAAVETKVPIAILAVSGATTVYSFADEALMGHAEPMVPIEFRLDDAAATLAENSSKVLALGAINVAAQHDGLAPIAMALAWFPLDRVVHDVGRTFLEPNVCLPRDADSDFYYHEEAIAAVE